MNECRSWGFCNCLCLLRRVMAGHPAPEIVEVHPPFKDYCKSIREFLAVYRPFAEKLAALFPGTKIFLENRCGSRYKGGWFLIAGIHLWGKKRSAKGNVVAHAGDLDAYFEDDEMKQGFLEELFRLLDDGQARYFVPEVNSGDEDLGRIVGEMRATGINLL